jgi:hypothetical protein
MNGPITQFFGHTVSNDAFDTKLGQGVCFLASVLILMVSLWELARLDLTEVQLFFGLLLSLAVPLLLLVVGLILPLAQAAWRRQI